MSGIEGKRIRKPAVAGTFYSDDPTALKEQIDFFLENLEENEIEGDIYGIISPHAGYMYSGQVAAAGYKQLLGRDYDVVLVIAPSHREYFKGVSAFCGEGYETPLGVIPVAEDLCRRLTEQSELIVDSWTGHREEHALEVQLPFLQRILGEFRLIPLVMGDQNYDDAVEVGEIIARILRHEKALVVASSDLSHYYPAAVAEKMDSRIIRHVNNFDYESLWNDIEAKRAEACGAGPIVSTMVATKKMGANKSEVLLYRHSGHVTGDESAVVGYLSAVMYRI